MFESPGSSPASRSRYSVLSMTLFDSIFFKNIKSVMLFVVDHFCIQSPDSNLVYINRAGLFP